MIVKNTKNEREKDGEGKRKKRKKSDDPFGWSEAN